MCAIRYDKTDKDLYSKVYDNYQFMLKGRQFQTGHLYFWWGVLGQVLTINSYMFVCGKMFKENRLCLLQLMRTFCKNH